MAAVQLWCRVKVVGPGGDRLACCVLEGPGAPDLGAVDAVARLALLARRLGGRTSCSRRSRLPCERCSTLAGLAVEMEGQAELGEEPLGVQEARKNAIPAILPPEISSTCKAHGA